VGLILLMAERKLGFVRLLFVGTGLMDYLDLLAREGWEDLVCEAGANALDKLGRWEVADLQELRPEALHPMLADWADAEQISQQVIGPAQEEVAESGYRSAQSDRGFRGLYSRNHL